MENNDLSAYQLTKKELFMLLLCNYEFGESLKDIMDWVKFQSIDEFAQRQVRSRASDADEYFRFCLNLDAIELNYLREYLLKRKSFVVNHILSRKSFEPYTHLYQLYLQYLPDKLNEVEKGILLDGYFHMLKDLQGEDLCNC